MAALKKVQAPKASHPHMPGYGLPKGTKGLLAWSWADERLKKSHNYWISTVKPDGSPHLMIVWGLWLNGALYFSTGRQSRKARNLATNPRCVMATDDSQEAVILEGEARLLDDSRDKAPIYPAYERKYKFNMAAYAEEPIYCLQPRVVFGLSEKKTLKAATRWKFFP